MAKELLIIGGGITGLTAAYLAAKSGHSVRVLEATEEPGGLLATFEVGPTRLEYYYHHFFTHDAEILWLIEQLGLTHQLYFKKSTMGCFRDGKIFPFGEPKDLLGFSPLGLWDRLRFAFTSAYLGKVAHWQTREDISALAWFNQFAGKSTTNVLWKPLLEMKFGPHAKDISLSWMIGRLRQRMNSRKGTEEKLGYLKGSLNTLLTRLLVELDRMGATIITDCKVTELHHKNERLTSLQTTKGVFEAERYLFTIPNALLPDLVAPISPEYAKELSKVKYCGAICTILELDRKFSDIYWLNVTDSGFPFGGIIEQTNFVGSEVYGGRHILYLSRYFDHTEEIANMNEKQIAKMMIAPLKRINTAFDESWILKKHVFRAKYAAPICDQNFSMRVPMCRSPIEGMYVVNMAHIYPDERSVNNSIRIASNALRGMGLEGAHIPRGRSLAGLIGF